MEDSLAKMMYLDSASRRNVQRSTGRKGRGEVGSELRVNYLIQRSIGTVRGFM